MSIVPKPAKPVAKASLVGAATFKATVAQARAAVTSEPFLKQKQDLQALREQQQYDSAVQGVQNFFSRSEEVLQELVYAGVNVESITLRASDVGPQVATFMQTWTDAGYTVTQDGQGNITIAAPA